MKVADMSKEIVILNGPNLNLLGKREPHIYGSDTLPDVERNCAAIAAQSGYTIKLQQSNSEGAIVDMIHAARETACAIVINPAAYTHTSVAIIDALSTFEGPVIEVHISNTHKREEFRHHSYVSKRAEGVIMGCGIQGYEFGVMRVIALTSN